MKIQRKPSRAEVPAMAMGDIAFNLLIFFVILARVNDDSHIKWKPSDVEKTDGARPTLVSVVIDVDNKRWLNGQEVDLAALKSGIEELLKTAPRGERIVHFKIHRDSTARIVQNTYEAIGKAGADAFIVVESRRRN